jgi:hypothetical protein
MKINNIFLLSILTIVQYQVWGQSASPTPKTAYDSLYSRYLNADTTLTKIDFINLYYASPQYANVDYNAIHNIEQSLKACNRAGQYAQTLIIGDSLLKYPYINLTALMECSFAYHALSNEEKTTYYFKRHDLFCYLIQKSGTGSMESPFLVNNIGDAIDFLASKKLYAINDLKLDNDLIKVSLAKNKLNLNVIYFKMPTNGYVLIENDH